MTPLRAAVLLALEKACRANVGMVDPDATDELYAAYGRGATIARISYYVNYPDLVHLSSVRHILIEERVAGRVLQDVVDVAHRWWPVGLAAKLKDRQ